MTRHHHQAPPRYHGVRKAARGLASAAMLLATTIGIPWLFLTLAGSPIPNRLPSIEEIGAWLRRPDDGTLFLGFITYLGWATWLAWIAMLIQETAAQLRGRSAPQITGLGGPQALAALMISGLGATTIGTSLSTLRTLANSTRDARHQFAAGKRGGRTSGGEIADAERRGSPDSGAWERGGRCR